MSLVALKNVFFQKTVTPISAQSRIRRTDHAGPVDWDNSSRRPLLSASDRGNAVSEQSQQQVQAHECESDTDVESQKCGILKKEDGSLKKRFRVDARVISDATIGLSDGLTVPFALTAGLSALGNTKVVIYGGFAELIAGAISMGLGGYLGAKSEAQVLLTPSHWTALLMNLHSASYAAQREETLHLIATNPQVVMQEVRGKLQPYNFPKATLNDFTSHLVNEPRFADFVMEFLHCEGEPASSRAFVSAITIAMAYFLGGLLPLLPYFFVGHKDVYEGLYISIGVMVVALFTFGYVKTCVVVGWSGGKRVRAGCFGGIQMVVVGGTAAAAAMGLVKLFNQDDGAVVGGGL